MLAITENIADASARRPAIGTPRLQLKPAHRSCGFLPRRLVAPINRTDQRTALTSGSTPVTGRLNRPRAISRNRLVPNAPEHQTPGRPGDPWGPPRMAERRITIRSAVREAGPAGGTPHTEPTHPYNAVTTAASVNDASTPDQRLGISTRRDDDPLLSPVALQRWESDGGAVLPPRSQAQMQDA